MRVVLVGAGTYGQTYLSYLRESNEFEIVGFLDDSPHLQGVVVQGLPVLGTSDCIERCNTWGVGGIIVAIGNNSARVRILRGAQSIGLATPNFIHETAIVSKDARVGNGVYILPGSIVMPYADIHDFVMISMGVNLAHHTILQDGVFLSTGANVGAGISVGQCAFVGIGATVMTGVESIGEFAVVGAGAVVIRDVAPNMTVAGVPAKPL